MWFKNVLCIETLILIVTLLILLRIYIYKKWQYFKKINIPHPEPSLWELGNVKEFLINPRWLLDSYAVWKKKFGKNYGTYTFLTPQITISDPEIIKQIYIKEFSTFPDRQRTLRTVNGKVMNTTLLVSDGERWKRIRNTLTPTFSAAKLKEMLEIMENCCERMVQRLKIASHENDGRFDTKLVFGTAALDIICSSAFSVDTHPQGLKDGEESTIIKMAKKAFGFNLIGSPLIILCLFFPPFEKVLSFFNYSIMPKDTVNYFSRLTESVINQRKVSKEKPRVDLMQLMVDAEISEKDACKENAKGLTRMEITSNSVLMVLAGYETSANLMCFLAHNLAVYKEAQRMVQEEISHTLDEYGSFTYEALNSMKYLTSCIQETLRLYPPIAINSRFPIKDVTINGIFFQKGIQVNIPVYGLSRDDEIWDEPLNFKPERMSDMSKINPMVFQPFGGGPRGCIGMRFALMEIKLVFCKFLQQFNIDVCEDTPEPPLDMLFRSTTLKPKEDIFLKLSRREY